MDSQSQFPNRRHPHPAVLGAVFIHRWVSHQRCRRGHKEDQFSPLSIDSFHNSRSFYSAHYRAMEEAPR